MKALSLHQPWATLIVAGCKQFETRGWQTDHRGPLVIHASKATLPAYADLCRHEPFLSRLPAPPDRLPRGVLLGTVELIDGFHTEDVIATLDPIEPAFGDYGPQRWAWLLSDPQPFPNPIQFRGLQGLFSVDAATIQKARQSPHHLNAP